ncbi:MAG: ABC transporter permease [Deinococcales bacterium]
MNLTTANLPQQGIKKAHPLVELWQKATQDLYQEVSAYRLGALWWFFEPALSLISFYIIFGIGLRGAGHKGDNFLVFLMIGIMTWGWFASVIQGVANKAANRSRKNPKKQQPLWAIVVQVFFSQSIKFGIEFSLLAIAMLLSGYYPHKSYILVPFLLVSEALFILGLGFITAILVPKLADLKFVIQHSLRFLYFMSGIFYDITSFKVKLQRYFYLNPVALLIKSYRDTLIHYAIPRQVYLLSIGSLALLVFVIGLWSLGLAGEFSGDLVNTDVTMLADSSSTEIL